MIEEGHPREESLLSTPLIPFRPIALPVFDEGVHYEEVQDTTASDNFVGDRESGNEPGSISR